MFGGLKKFLRVYPLPIFIILLTFIAYYSAFEFLNTNKNQEAITEAESMLRDANASLIPKENVKVAQIQKLESPAKKEIQTPKTPQEMPQDVKESKNSKDINDVKDSKILVTSKVKSLNIRKSPSTKAQVVGKFTPQDSAFIVQESGEWILIATEYEKLGWILKQYSKEIKQESNKLIKKDSVPLVTQKNNAESKPVQTTEIIPIPIPKKQEISKTQTTTKAKQPLFTSRVSSLNIRNKPSSAGLIIGKLTPQDFVHIVEEENGWAKIVGSEKTPNKRGYVIRRSLVEH